MAKNKQADSRSSSSTQDRSVIELAERLYVENWQPTSGYTSRHFAEKCLAGAREFYEALDDEANHVEDELATS
jgi:hypothetical protein